MNESSPDVSRAVEAALQLHMAKRYKEALDSYHEILQAAPNNATLLRLIGLAHRDLGDSVRAAEYLEKSLKISFMQEVFFELGQAYCACARGAEFLERHVPGLLAYSMVHELYQLGSKLFEDKCYQGAEKVLCRGAELYPSALPVRESYIRALFLNGKYEQAAAEYRQFLALSGKDPSEREIFLGRLMHMRDYCRQEASCRYVCLKKERPGVQLKMGPYGEEFDPYIISTEPEFYLAEVENVSFVSGKNFLLGQNNSIIYDLAVHPLVERYDLAMSDIFVKYYDCEKMLLDLPGTGRIEAEFEGGILLSGLAIGFWSHWLLEYAPFFWSIDQFPEYQHLPLLVDEKVFGDPHIVETLNILKNGHPVIKLKCDARYSCKSLVVPSRLVHLPHDLKQGRDLDFDDTFISRTAVLFLRSKLYKKRKMPSSQSKRVFMLREDSPYRRLINEAEVHKIFKEFGFVTVKPHQLSYQEKVELFGSVEAIAGAGGSAFLNNLFAPGGTKLFELVTENGMKGTSGATWYSILEQPLFVIKCRSIPGSHGVKFHENIEADLDLVRKVLSENL